MRIGGTHRQLHRRRGRQAQGALLGWWDGIEAYWAGFWANTIAAVGIDEWLFRLAGYKSVFFDTVTGWWDGIKEWFAEQWEAVMSVVPQFVLDGLRRLRGGGAADPSWAPHR